MWPWSPPPSPWAEPRPWPRPSPTSGPAPPLAPPHLGPAPPLPHQAQPLARPSPALGPSPAPPRQLTASLWPHPQPHSPAGLSLALASAWGAPRGDLSGRALTSFQPALRAGRPSALWRCRRSPRPLGALILPLILPVFPSPRSPPTRRHDLLAVSWLAVAPQDSVHPTRAGTARALSSAAPRAEPDPQQRLLTAC